MRLSLARGMALVLCLSVAALAAAQGNRAPPTPAVAARPAAPLYITAQPDVIIPFTIHAKDAQGRPPAKVRIFVSHDQGQAWVLYDELKPEEKGFRFRAKKDGEFWFATQTINIDGTGDRETGRQAQLKLVVDTTKPRLQIVPKIDDTGKLTLSWAAADPYLAPHSVRLEWQDSSTGTWQEITPADKPAVTRGQFAAHGMLDPPSGLASIVLRGEAADTAGNKTIVSQPFELKPAGETGKAALLPSAPGNGALVQRWTPESNDPFTRQPSARSQQSLDPALPRVKSERELATVGPYNPLPPPRSSADDDSPPQVVRNPYASASNTPARPANTGELLPPANEALPPPIESSSPGSTSPSLSGPTNEYLPPQPEALARPEQIDSLPLAPPRRVEAISPPQGSRPRMTNAKRFSLDYDIESVGPEGVADVELWGTADRGQTWVKWGSDPDRATPFEVEVSNEAIYGFRIVIVGRNGLASNTPQAGDAADIWVGVDLAKPHVRLTGATIAGGEQSGKLEIRWEAADEHFGPRPISLSVSDRVAGPFTPIAAGLPNAGVYYWEFDPRVRRQLFLRIEAQDEAGNLTAHQLTDPILIEGLAPKGRIRDLAPAPNPPPQAFRSPLFR